MSQVLPPFFIVLAGLVLVLSIYAFWTSVRGLLQASAKAVTSTSVRSEARLALIDEKASLLKALRELQFERDMGKLSEQDYDALNTRYRMRAKQVLRELDQQLGDFQDKAQALVDNQLKGASRVQKNSAQAEEG